MECPSRCPDYSGLTLVSPITLSSSRDELVEIRRRERCCAQGGNPPLDQETGKVGVDLSVRNPRGNLLARRPSGSLLLRLPATFARARRLQRALSAATSAI